MDTERGWAAVGEINRGQPPPSWPPRPENTPKTDRSSLMTRVMFGCLPVIELEQALDMAFADDQRFVQTGVGPTRPGGRRAGGKARLTCRGSFLLDAGGLPLADSLSYSPLIDFARHVQANLAGDPDRQRAVTEALRVISQREMDMRERWERVVDGPEDRDPAELVLELLGTVSVQVDVFRYVTEWVPDGEQPPGQLPAFFRDDLLAAAGSPRSRLVAAYLAGPQGRPAAGRDVADRGVLAGLMSPARLPRAAWPGEHLPRLSQQVAVGALLGPDAEPLMAVNGPPGTGKTTLLRDLYANVLTDRAEVLVGYPHPETAFGARREVPSGTQRVWELFAPAAPLCGFEMLVASSNNAAVENVSQELPRLDQVAPGLRQRVSYFRTATEAERVGPAAGRHDGEVGKGTGRPSAGRPGLLPEGAPAWGLAAAVLGSRGRVSTFAAVVGRYRREPGPGGGLLAQLKAGATSEEWVAARRRFVEARDAVRRGIAALEEVATGIESVDPLVETVRSAAQAMEDTDRRIALCRTATERALLAEVDADSSAATTEAALRAVRARRPSVLSRVFRTHSAVRWAEQERAARGLAEASSRVLTTCRDTITARQAEEQVAQDATRSALERHRATSEQLALLRTMIEACPQRMDDAWWQTPRRERELSPVWVDGELHRRQAELFAAAIHVHDVFARRAGRQMAANLRLWMALQTKEVEATTAREVTLAAWQAFFLLVPLASTTFASMARLLQDVPAGSLGWLVVDEAGQAVPAAAVGGLSRCRRAVVVGDPQQLQPVVSLPAALVAELMRHHHAPAELAPNRASVQTLADSVSRFGTDRLGQWIGLPLVVHNRCLDPMFGVANEVAYGGEMVQGRLTPGEEHPLGPSRWIDIPRPEGAHFRREDAEQVLAMLRELNGSRSGADPPLPSIAIITPFKEVRRELERLVRAEVLGWLPPELREDETERQKALEWVQVGTVHTFQGREKVAVILVLGGGTAGSREWAAGTPNLLNVAVTRAKDRLIVIGDRARWRTVGHMRTLDAHLPVEPSAGTGTG